MNELREKWSAVINYIAYDQSEDYKNELASRLDKQEILVQYSREGMQDFFRSIQEELKNK